MERKGKPTPYKAIKKPKLLTRKQSEKQFKEEFERPM